MFRSIYLLLHVKKNRFSIAVATGGRVTDSNHSKGRHPVHLVTKAM